MDSVYNIFIIDCPFESSNNKGIFTTNRLYDLTDWLFSIFGNKNGKMFDCSLTFFDLTKMYENSLNCRRIGNTPRMEPPGKKVCLRIDRNYSKTVSFHKISTAGNQMKLRYFTKCLMQPISFIYQYFLYKMMLIWFTQTVI